MLDNISIMFELGKVYAIVGPNGAGKTTLLRTIVGIVKPKTGSVKVFGKPLERYRRIELAKILAYAAAEPPKGFNAKVIDFLETSLYPLSIPYTERMKLIQTVAEEFGIEEFLYRRLDTLSSGELQRVVLASAFVRRPRIVLIDEPTAHLDLKHGILVLKKIREYVDKNNALAILVLHDLRLASMFSDTIVLLNKGRIAAFGDVVEVFREDILSEVYGIRCRVLVDPIYGPFIIPEA